MNPTFVRLSSGGYVKISDYQRFSLKRDASGTLCVTAGVPGLGTVPEYLYAWRAYPMLSQEIDFKGAALSFNEVCAQEMLDHIVIHLADDRGGVIDLDDLAAEIVAEQGLETLHG